MAGIISMPTAGGRRRAGTRDGTKEQAGHHGRGGQAAGEGAGKAFGNVDQAARQAGSLHQCACQNECGQCHQRERPDRGPCHLHHLDRVVAKIQHGRQRRDPQRDRYWCAQHQQSEKGSEEDFDQIGIHQWFPRSKLRCSSAASSSAASTPALSGSVGSMPRTSLR